MTPKMRAILRAINEEGITTCESIARYTGLSETETSDLIRLMCERGYIEEVIE